VELDQRKTKQENDEQEGKEEVDLMDNFCVVVEVVSQPQLAREDTLTEKERKSIS
jgi:hypothetical protein